MENVFWEVCDDKQTGSQGISRWAVRGGMHIYSQAKHPQDLTSLEGSHPAWPLGMRCVY